MLVQVYLGIALLAAVPVWSQVAPSASGGNSVTDDSAQMTTPPPVSGESYTTTVGSEARSNYLGIGFTFTPAYDDNAFPGGNAKPVSDVNYLISSAFTLDRSTPRQHETLTYSPGFNIYQPTSALNSIDQSAGLTYQYRLSPGTTLHLGDTFTQTSNAFDNSPIFSGTGISGSTLIPTSSIIVPFAEQRTNTANASISYQFSRDAMIGAGGVFSTFTFPNLAQATGLNDSQTTGGSAFYARRLTSSQYIGVGYQYSRYISFYANEPFDTQVHSIAPYYTFSLGHRLSSSLSAGIAHFSSVESNLPAYASWSPTVSASVGWQQNNIAVAASYSRTISAGEGLLGAFSSSSVNASGHWRVARSWNIGLVMSYSAFSNESSLLSSSYPGGNTISGQASIQRAISEHFNAQIGYQRLHESYRAITVISNDPDSDREFLSITYQISRPIGR